MERRDSRYIGRRMLKMELPDRKLRESSRRRVMDVARENMPIVNVREEDAVDSGGWRRMIHCGDSSKNFVTLKKQTWVVCFMAF